VLVDYSDFERVSAPDPEDPRRFYRPDEFDFTLRARSRAIDMSGGSAAWRPFG